MIISHNLTALNTMNKLKQKDLAVSKSLGKLSSGLRINGASDDAAGLAISEKMRGQIRGLNQASRNIQDGISLIQVADGAMQEIHSMLQRMNELAVQASNGTYSGSDRLNIQSEVEQLIEEIDEIAGNTGFNGIKLLNGNNEKTEKTEKTGSVVSVNNPPNNKLITISSPVGTSVSEILNNLLTVFNEAKNGQVGDSDSKRVSSKFTLSINNDELSIVCDTGDGFLLSGGSPNLFYQGYIGGSYKYKFTEFINENDFINIMDIGGANGGDTLKFNFSSISKEPEEQKEQKGLTLQIGANSGETLNIKLPNVTTSAIGISSIDVSTIPNAESSLSSISAAIDKVSAERARMGAYQNRLEHSRNNVVTYAENLTAAESRIRDVDMAKEMMELMKNQIFTQAGQAMLLQTNTQPQAILQLLK
ncbi:flagellin N-terminal helical domain-containing protein [Paenibacillus sp. HW567]|uniref:flagellin N-terminal helical domain-containing protein n=1 Tax=Paenibacillus sp. HW567 TaxID=1034769 RepID=UPI00035EFEDF|nr:flagellin [Paenibacillus sp. HW567]